MPHFIRFIYALLFVLCSVFMLQAQNLPRVYIIGTGGTIAGKAGTSTVANYEPSQLSIATILETLPELSRVAQIESEQIFTISSQDMTDEHWLKLLARVQALLARSDVDGIVITQGTDTMEETAFFLSLTVTSPKPVVLTGAMRPANSIGADGRMNLFDAVLVAGSEHARGYGALIVMNGKILPARNTTKMSTTHLETFQSPVKGILGEVIGEDVNMKPAAGRPEIFDVRAFSRLPRVDILYGYTAASASPVEALIKDGAQGIVYAGVGNGNVPASVLPALSAVAKKGVFVVRSSRIPTGHVTIYGELDDVNLGFITANDFNPQKARILLMLALTKTKNRKQLQHIFSSY